MVPSPGKGVARATSGRYVRRPLAYSTISPENLVGSRFERKVRGMGALTKALQELAQAGNALRNAWEAAQAEQLSAAALSRWSDALHRFEAVRTRVEEETARAAGEANPEPGPRE